MANRAGAFKLIGLLTGGLNGRANERAFARPIGVYREGRRGTANSSSARTTTSRARRRCLPEPPSAESGGCAVVIAARRATG
jgi:hypothetical protein